MTAKTTIKVLSVSAALLLGGSLCAQAQNSRAAEGARRPNILLIIGDDIGMDVMTNIYPGLIDGLVEQYGPKGLDNPDYQKINGSPAVTPTLDRLARQGMRFTSAWAHPFCSPTRAAVITGLFAAKTQVTNYQEYLTQNFTTFVHQLKDEGNYSTAIFGKWHLAGLPGNPSYPGMKPKQAGFDVFRGNLHAAIGTYWDYDYQVQDADTPADQWLNQKPPTKSLPGIAPTTYAPVVKVADTIDWITAQERADADKPWFAWLAFNLSHATIQRMPDQMAVPDKDTLNSASYEEIRDCGGTFGTQDGGSCSGESLMRAMSSSLDTVLGKLLEAVDDLDPNTYVIYIGDNGTPMYGRPNLDFIDNMYITRTGRGKGTAYESGARVPLLVRGPGIEADSESNAFVHVADLYSTILEFARLDPPKSVSNRDGTGTVSLDSHSLTPILFNKAESVRDPNDGYVLAETMNLMTGGTRQVGARNQTYKVLCKDKATADSCEFYSLVDDPLEEYPLPKPASCADYANGKWTPADRPWHFCRLTEVVKTESFMQGT